MARTPGSKTNQKDVFENVEFLELSKDQHVEYTFSGKDIEGKTKFEIQKKIGEMFGSQTFTATLKFKGIFQTKVFRLRGIKIGEPVVMNKNTDQKETSSLDISSIKNVFDKSDQTFQMHLDLQKQNYEDRIKQRDEVIADLRSDLKLLKAEIKQLQEDKADLEKDLIELEKESSSGNNILDMVQQAMKLKDLFGKKGAPAGSLDNIPSSPDEIPTNIKSALGKVDWAKIPEQDQTKLITMFESVSNQLPLKQSQVN